MNTLASVNYHVRSKSSQAFIFDMDGIASNLISPELRETDVEVEDLREKLDSLDFDTDGLTLQVSPSNIADFESDDSWQQAYNAEITALLKSTIGAEEVVVFDHTLRVDDENASRKPATNVHNDYSAQSAEQRLLDLVGEAEAEKYRAGSFGFVNVWRPVSKVIKSSPLGFIKPKSVDANDWLNIDLIYPERKGQILGLTANTNHEWFYISDMTPSELLIFNIYHNQGRPHLAHSALDVKQNTPRNEPRKSIETRTLVRYAS